MVYVKTMKKIISKVALFTLIFLISPSVFAKSEFCQGFEEGYKSVKGNMVIVPICPIAPITPIGSTPFREGIKAGIRAARRS